jgi:carbon starvation protein
MYAAKDNLLLMTLNMLVLGVSIWVIIEGLVRFFKTDGSEVLRDAG